MSSIRQSRDGTLQRCVDREASLLCDGVGLTAPPRKSTLVGPGRD